MLKNPTNIHEYHKTWDALKRAERVLIVVPKAPDADNLGSSLALYHGLKQRMSTVAMTTVGVVDDTWEYLPGVRDIVPADEHCMRVPWDIVVVADVSDLPYSGVADLLERFPKRPMLMNIDHHTTNLMFGDVNLVDADAAAAVEVIAHLLRLGSISLTPEMATCLLAGLLADTGFFTNPATNDRALAFGGYLIERGARYGHVFSKLMHKQDPRALKLWGRVLERMRMHATTGLAVTVIYHADLEETGCAPESVEGIANFLNVLGEAKAVCILREDGRGNVKGSFRTTHPDVDVSKLALVFGGGGHKKAAGFTLPNCRIRETDGRWVCE